MVGLLATCIAFAGMNPPEPVLKLGLDGEIWVRGSRFTPRLRPGTGAVACPGGTAFSFDGVVSGIMLGDPSSLALTKSISVAAWIKLESYLGLGPGAQILFRGDDRSGLDPYTLTILGDGKVYFSVNNTLNEYGHVLAPVPLRQWTHILASLDDSTGEMELWINGRVANRGGTKIRPLARLDRTAVPGVSIGNVQFDRGPHNQPLRGQIADLRLYDRVVTPTDIRLLLAPWHHSME